MKRNKKKATIENVVAEHSVNDVATTLAQISTQEQATDILGSYTGNPKDPDDPIPVQDADDL